MESISSLREINKANVIRLMIEKNGVSRVDLAEKLGLSRSAMTHIVRELINEDLVVKGQELKSGVVGRSPIELSINPEGRYAVGVQIGDNYIMITMANWLGDIKYKKKIENVENISILECIDRALIFIKEAMAMVSREKILGIGVGVPGLVDYNTGQLLLIPNLHDNYVLIGKFIESNLCLPVIVDNDVNMMAMGELHYGRAQGYRNVVCINVNWGIGSGIIVNRQIYRGSTGISGEIGHTIVDINGPKCGCGNSGCLETLAGGRALIEICKKELGEDNLGVADTANAFKWIRSKIDAGHPALIEGMKKVATYLGVGVVNAIHTNNPDVCVLEGQVIELFPEIMAEAEATARKYLLSSAKETLIIQSSLGEAAAALGAIASVVNQSFQRVTITESYP
jgi:predicted NBD/HSP70 family sugar kinase